MTWERKKGFSLTELMVVIGIFAVVTAMAVPALNHYSANTNLRTAARAIASDIFMVKEKAISEDRQYRITYNAATGSYTIEQGTHSGTPYTTIQVKSVTAAASDAKISAITFLNQQIVFQTRGTVTSGNLTLANRLGSTATITVNTVGRTYVQFSMQ